MEKNIIFISGAFHRDWCWNKYFTEYFESEGYIIHIHNLSQDASTIKESLTNLNKTINNLKGDYSLISHSMGNLLINELYTTKFDTMPNKIVFLMPYPITNRLRNSYKINKRYQELTKEKFFFSERVSNSMEYINKMNSEPIKIRMLPILYKPANKLLQNCDSLILASDNDQCIHQEQTIKTSEAYLSKLKVFKNICHDCMLDPDWEKVACEIKCFLNS